MAEPRRVVTAPLPRSPSDQSQKQNQTSAPAATTSSASEDLVEILYNHPSVKIIAFTSSQRGSMATLPVSLDDVRPGSLVASSRLERTIAVGAFRIYRAPGSVAFLSCGSALQPILPKSQCWCIEENNSRFVLQIRRPQYWRIEVPVSEPDDVQRALVLRDVFDHILLFEKTECPFQRNFTVELPEPPKTPVKKKAWSPIGKNLIPSPFQNDLSSSSPPPRPIFRERRATVGTREIPTPKTVIFPTEEEQREIDQAEALNTLLSPSAKESQRPISTEAICDTPTDTSNLAQLHSPRLRGPRPSRSVSVDHSRAVRMPINLKHMSMGANSRAFDLSRDAPFMDSLAQLPERCVDQPAASIAEAHTDDNDISFVNDSRTNRPNVSEPRGTLDGGANVPSLPTDSSHTISHSPVSSNSVQAEDPHSLHTINSDPSKEGISDDHQDDGPSSFEGSGYVAPVNLKRKRMSRMLAGRAYAPARQLSLNTTMPSRPKEPEPPKQIPQAPPKPPVSNTTSAQSSTDSFHTVQSSVQPNEQSDAPASEPPSMQPWHSPITPLPPSPPSSRPVTPPPPPAKFPYPHENIVIPEPPSHDKGSSDHAASPQTVVPSSAAATTCSDETASPVPRSPDSIDDEPLSFGLANRVIKSPWATAREERPQLRHRPRGNSISINRRALSPLPPAANLFTPPHRQNPQGRFDAVRKLPGTIVQKTVEILLRPPGHLVKLMLKVAARIAAGEWRGLVFGFGEAGEHIPVEWDYSDDEFSSWGDDDDYAMADHFGRRNSDGLPHNNRHSHQRRRSSMFDDRSWEVD
ncbi:inheritance of peroxisomes protein 1-domain-containing protein [Biscogniauxia mediterranea]|nr:inheritance of peroxisomes protein 1-domain-containing protein [Biscogniauxia mediterranea]